MTKLLHVGVITLATFSFQQSNILEEIRQLRLLVLPGPTEVRYPPGGVKRAEGVQALLDDARAFFRLRFQQSPDLTIALLGPTEWRAFNNNQPIAYTTMLPGVFGRNPAVMVLASETGSGLDALVQRVNPNAEAGLRYNVLVGLHELGHLYVTALALPVTESWFSEFLATYIAYGYLRDMRPEDADFWQATCQALYKELSHPITALEAVHTQVGVENYVWYQSSLQLRVDELYRQRGWQFVDGLQKETEGSLGKGPQLRMNLERLAPGFATWARTNHSETS